jgi:hypothetical protein
MAVPVSRPDQPAVYLDTLYVNPVTSTSLLSFILKRVKLLAVSVTSIVTIVQSIIRNPRTKAVNGAAINMKSLG